MLAKNTRSHVYFVSNNVFGRIQPKFQIEIQRLSIGLPEGAAEGIFRDTAVYFVQVHSSLLGKGDNVSQSDGRHGTRTQQRNRLSGQGNVFHEFLEFEQRSARPSQDPHLPSADRMIGIDGHGIRPVANHQHPPPLTHFPVSFQDLVGLFGRPEPGGHSLRPYSTAVTVRIITSSIRIGTRITQIPLVTQAFNVFRCVHRLNRMPIIRLSFHFLSP